MRTPIGAFTEPGQAPAYVSINLTDADLVEITVRSPATPFDPKFTKTAHPDWLTYGPTAVMTMSLRQFSDLLQSVSEGFASLRKI